MCKINAELECLLNKKNRKKKTEKKTKKVPLKTTNCTVSHVELKIKLDLRAENIIILAAVGFEPTPLSRLVPKTSALDHSATLPDEHNLYNVKYLICMQYFVYLKTFSNSAIIF